MEDVVERGNNEIVKPLSYNICKKIKGIGRICPYSMPSGYDDYRICQKNGAKCISGLKIEKYNIKIYNSASKEEHTYEISEYLFDNEQKLHIKINKNEQ